MLTRALPGQLAMFAGNGRSLAPSSRIAAHEAQAPLAAFYGTQNGKPADVQSILSRSTYVPSSNGLPDILVQNKANWSNYAKSTSKLMAIRDHSLPAKTSYVTQADGGIGSALIPANGNPPPPPDSTEDHECPIVDMPIASRNFGSPAHFREPGYEARNKFEFSHQLADTSEQIDWLKCLLLEAVSNSKVTFEYSTHGLKASSRDVATAVLNGENAPEVTWITLSQLPGHQALQNR